MWVHSATGEWLNYFPFIALSCSAYFIGAASPGPANLAIAAVAMGQGRKQALLLAMGVLLGSLSWGVIAAFGLAALLASFAAGLTFLKVLGGLYLLFLSYKAAKSALRTSSSIHLDKGKHNSFFWRGFGLHLTNPKAAFNWSAVIALGLHPGAPSLAVFSILLVCGILGALIFAFYAVIFSNPRIVALYIRFRRSIEAALAFFFGFAGIKLLLSVK